MRSLVDDLFLFLPVATFNMKTWPKKKTARSAFPGRHLRQQIAQLADCDYLKKEPVIAFYNLLLPPILFIVSNSVSHVVQILPTSVFLPLAKKRVFLF